MWVNFQLAFRTMTFHPSGIGVCRPRKDLVSLGVLTKKSMMILTVAFLYSYGCCLFCCCCENKLPPKARRLKRALDSIEAYRTQQQEKLRENYTQQVTVFWRFDFKRTLLQRTLHTNFPNNLSIVMNLLLVKILWNVIIWENNLATIKMFLMLAVAMPKSFLANVL